MQISPLRLSALFFLLLLPSCAKETPHRAVTPPRSLIGFKDREEPVVKYWGGMREVLREGRTEGRVGLAEVLGPHTVAVGVTAGLAAEITVFAGEAHLAEVVDLGSVQGQHQRAPSVGEQATLLVLAQVEEWSEHHLAAVPDLTSLETSVRAIAAANGIDVTRPFPFRVEGVASTLRLHVLNQSCPIAKPDGPQPWRFSGEEESAVLVGFYAEDSAGSLTHHGQKTHTHALIPGRNISGHLDAVALLSDARVYLPAR